MGGAGAGGARPRVVRGSRPQNKEGGLINPRAQRRHAVCRYVNTRSSASSKPSPACLDGFAQERHTACSSTDSETNCHRRCCHRCYATHSVNWLRSSFVPSRVFRALPALTKPPLAHLLPDSDAWLTGSLWTCTWCGTGGRLLGGLGLHARSSKRPKQCVGDSRSTGHNPVWPKTRVSSSQRRGLVDQLERRRLTWSRLQPAYRSPAYRCPACCDHSQQVLSTGGG